MPALDHIAAMWFCFMSIIASNARFASSPPGASGSVNGEDSLSWTRRDTAWAIQGVPFCFLLQKYGVSGAQPPDFWRDALPKTLRRRPPPRLDQEGR
jgi:hypothetical protein